MTDEPQRQYLEDVPSELQDLLYEGRKIAAIKLAREKMGWGLKGAKERVEAVQVRMREQFPGALPSQQRAGCGAAVLVCAVLLWAVSYLAARAI